MRNIILLLTLVSFATLNSACSNKVAFTKELSPQEAMSGQFISESFTQGYSSKRLDVLVVVDNSGSMTEEQERMGEKIGSFLSSLYDIDWQLAITTTDVSDGPYGVKGELLNFEGLSSYILTPKTPNYESVFKATVVRQEGISCRTNCPSGNEQAMAATIMAIEKASTVNKGFFRSGSDLAVLVLSDEDEMSTGPAEAIPPEGVLAAATQMWGDQKKVYGYGMIIQPGDQTCLSMNGGIGNYGDFVSQLAFITGGLTGSICDADFGPSLTAIGDRARKLLEGVKLSFYPETTTVSLTFKPAHTTTWTIEGKRIVFDNPPPKGTIIDVYYQVL